MKDAKTCWIKANSTGDEFEKWVEATYPELTPCTIMEAEDDCPAIVLVSGKRLISAKELLVSGMVESCYVPIAHNPERN